MSGKAQERFLKAVLVACVLVVAGAIVLSFSKSFIAARHRMLYPHSQPQSASSHKRVQSPLIDQADEVEREPVASKTQKDISCPALETYYRCVLELFGSDFHVPTFPERIEACGIKPQCEIMDPPMTYCVCDEPEVDCTEDMNDINFYIQPLEGL